MPVIWNFKRWLAERGITGAAEVSKLVRERTGFTLSPQAVWELMNGKPKMLRLETSQALCDAFYCRQSDFFEVMPRASRSRNRKKSPTDTSNNTPTEATTAQENSKVDFAAFLPDARKFSRDN